MNTDQQIAQGDFQGALTELRRVTSHDGADPAQLLSRFNLEVRLQEFDAAETTMQRLCAAAPQVAPVMGGFGLAARAERLATERLTNPTLATKRATVGLPPPHALAYVKMAFHHAQRDYANAALALAEAKSLTPRTAGTLTRTSGHTQPFVHITDTDELTGGTLPCYEGQSLLDLAYSDIKSISFGEAKTSFDVMWRPAEVFLVTGQVLRVRIPAFYPGSGRAEMPPLRIGQMTSWARDKGYAEGMGQRDLALSMPDGSSSIVGFLGIASMTFDNPMRAAVGGVGSNASSAWTTPQKVVAAVAGIMAFVVMFQPRLLFAFSASPRWPALAFGAFICGGVYWITSQRSTKTVAFAAVAVAFVVTTLKWVL